MCGFCGEIRFAGEASLETIDRMMPHLARRGPDASGVFAQGAVALGHRRLKIIDLSEQSQQPMVDSELGLAIVYNGAIYNFQELRAELEGYGYRFFSHGDTEVLIKAFHRWREDMVTRLQGMFSFAIRERDSGRMFMARDRLGIKPMYLAEVNGGLRFASNVQALLASGGIDTKIDPVALHHYMTFHAVVPPPYTMLRGVRKLPQATWMMIEPDGTRHSKTYWEASFDPDPASETMTEEDWYDQVLDVMRRSVKRRLIADVPVGVLLSGGLDSSLVVGLLAEAGQTGLHTFSIGFETVGDEEGDEFKYSDIIAQHFATDHHKLFIDSTRALTAMPDCVDAMSEPMVSHDVIGFYLLSEKVSQHIRVVQSGQGADEIFGGYHWYPPMVASTDPLNDYAKGFFDRDHGEFAEAMNPAWVSEDFSRAFVADHFARPGAAAAVDKALRIDGTVMLVDDPVKRVDNTTMAWGLEARVPFLDHEVVELGARVPAALKVKDGGKYVLKEAARRVIPAGVIDRPKGYFPVPALKYLRGPFLDMVTEALNQPVAKSRGLFNPAYIDRLLADPEKHITPLRGSKLWQVALLELWLQRRGL
ncbi:MAG TPA: N-acetylglutaminylglutamine amidotransferase [Kiritimatiellia bacterium]|nr:N-acetylglutaminylglutamine amidotransferase [Kiritimatiellia bacterium]